MVIEMILAGTGGLGILLYNRLVRYRNEAENAWSQIDVELGRRHDLIPNLVEVMKKYMSFESGTLERVTRARGDAMGQPASLEQKIAQENGLSRELSNIFAVWENYPNLKADRQAMAVHEQLVSTENRLAYSRGYYNDIAANYNTLCESFPSVLVAGICSFQKRVMWTHPGD